MTDQLVRFPGNTICILSNIHAPKSNLTSVRGKANGERSKIEQCTITIQFTYNLQVIYMQFT